MGVGPIVAFLVPTLLFSACKSTQIVKLCETPACPPLPDSKNCYYQPNANGCPTCNLICNPPGCPQLKCRAKCFNGFEKDEQGCNTCVCKPGCYKKRCSTTCPYGNDVDAAGCPICQCRDPPLPCHKFLNCPQGACRAICSCKPFCDPIFGLFARNIVRNVF